jgi:hypothetical protein
MKKMKRFLTTLFVALASFVTVAQTTDDTTLKFLGIPVDGSKYEMIQKLQKKGFKYDRTNDMLTGKFNGKESNIYISENYGKVDRIFVADADVVSASQIIINYNNLLYQFKKNEKYAEIQENKPIPENENVSYEMSVRNKNYDAQFFLKPQFTDEEKQEFAAKAEEIDDEDALGELLMGTLTDKITGMVWFRIAEYRGNYYICLYYDNLKNRPNGEDL